MKITTLAKAYPAICRLCAQELSFADAWALRQAKSAVVEAYGFVGEAERKIVAEYAKKDGSGKPVVDEVGRIELASQAAAHLFSKKMAELDAAEAEVRKAVLISPPVMISADDIDALQGIVDFKLPEPKAKPVKKKEDQDGI